MEDQQRADKQPLVKTSAVVAAGLASSMAAFFTSRFGVAGTVIGAALTTMIITAGSAVFGVYLERAAARARGGIPSGIPSVVRARPRRRSVLLGSLLAAVASFVVGMGAVTGLELSVGKSLSCWVWDECPANDGGGGRAVASEGTTRTRPSILGGGQRTVAPTSQPGRVEHPPQTAAPREQGVPASPRAPQGRPGGVGGASPGPRDAPQQGPAVPAEDAGPRQAPGGRQPAQEPSGGTAPPARHAPGEQPSPAPRDSDQPVPSDEPPAERPPPDRPLRPSPSRFQ